MYESQDDTTIFIQLTQDDIDKVCRISDIAWEKYFSKPLPGYNGMKVFWGGEIQFFHLLNRNDQLEIIKSAHVSKYPQEYINKQKNVSENKFREFINEFIGFNEGNLLECHGIAHSVRTAIMAQLSCQQYFNNFKEYANMNPRILFCAISAALLHDIGRCFGGDMYDVFGPLSTEIADETLTEVGGFSDKEIAWIKEAIDNGGISENDVTNFSEENSDFLDGRQMIACLMGDADCYEYERFGDVLCCNIGYTSVKKLDLFTKDGANPDEILNNLKMDAQKLSERISEPEIDKVDVNYSEFLRDELTKLNKRNA